MDWLRYDLRTAARDLVRRPGLSIVIIGTLAFGLGVNAVAFSAVDALFFASTRIPQADGAGWLFVGTRGNATANASLRTWSHLRDRATTLEHVAAEGRLPIPIDRDGAAEQAWGLAVSGDYFTVLPVRATVGRMLTPADDASPGVPVVISERLWRDRFGASAALGDLTLDVGGTTASIVGVAPDDFQGPGGLYAPDLWLPIAALDRLAIAGLGDDDDAQWLTLVGSPAGGAAPDAIEAEVHALVSGLDDAAAGDAPPEPTVRYVPLVDGHPELSQGLPQIFAAVLVSMTLLLLVACFNVAGLTLARSLERRRDLAVRSALGASPWRLIRAMLTEGLLMALAAAGAGLVLVLWSESLLGVFSLPAPIPQRLHFSVSGRLLGVLAVLVVFATTLPVLAPAWQVRRRDALASAGLSARGDLATGGTARRLFVRLQVAGSMLFLCLGLVVIQSFTRALNFDPGFDPDRIAVLQVTPALAGYSADESRALITTLLDRLAANPALEEVAAADRVPFYVGYPDARAVSPDAAPCEPADCDQSVNYAVTGRFFDAMGVPLVAGRTFDERAGSDDASVVINETAAERFWPGQSALGQTFREGADRAPRTVVGVVADFTQRGLDEPAQPVVYRPLTNDAFGRPVTIVARTPGDAAASIPVLLETTRAVDARLPPGQLQTMRERMALPLWFPRVIAGFFGFCGVLAMVLATVGLFGAAWYAVSRRTREFGVRLAVGAAPSDLRRLVVTEGLRLALPGVLLGLGAAIAVVLLARAMLPGVDPGHPGVYLAAATLQLAAIAAANWWPARRASSVDPLRALTAD